MKPSTEKVVLHFDFSHLPADTELTFIDSVKPKLMKAHTPQTRLKYRQTNKLLGLLNDEQLGRLSHFVEEAEFSTSEVSTSFITYPSTRPGAATGAIAGIYTHKPKAEVLRAAQGRLLQHSGKSPMPAKVMGYEVDEAVMHTPADGLLHAHHGELLADAGYTISYKDTAAKLVMQHPDIATMVAESYVRIEDVIWADPKFNRFARYIKDHNDDMDDDCWYENTIVRDYYGKVMSPCEDLKDKDGKLIVFPKMEVDGQLVSVIPQYKLRDDLIKEMSPLVNSVLETLRDMPSLKGENRSVQHGSTGTARTADDTKIPRAALLAADAPKPWTITASGSEYGVDVRMNTLNFDQATKKLSVDVKHWANRWTGVYIEFLDADGNGIEDPDGWVSQSSGLGNYDTNKTKRFLDTMGPGCIVFGFPIAEFTKTVKLDFPVPDNAATVRILFCGMGQGNNEEDICELGMTYTLLISYGLPAFLMMLSVGMQSNKKYIAFFEKRENVIMLTMVASTVLAPVYAEGERRIGRDGTLAKAGEFFAGILFSYGLKRFAMWLTEETSYQQFLQNQPAIGWMLKVASCASAIASIASTVWTVGHNPAIIAYEAKRSMSLRVKVKPDPTHGTSTEAPIWPETGVRYTMLVQYEGMKKTQSKDGPLPAKNDEPIDVTFSNVTMDALAIIPGKRFQVICTIYTKNNAVVGQWCSDWRQLLPGPDGGLTEEGSIIEKLVPLTANTRYEHKKKLAYSGGKYEWKPAAASTETALGLDNRPVSELSGITINNLAYKLGYTYRASSQHLPLDGDTRIVDTPMYVMKNVSVLNNPEKAMKFSGFGMSMQPALGYDQFGPAGIFELDPAANFMKDMNANKLSDEVKNLFKAQSLELPAGASVKVERADASWNVYVPNVPNPKYVLRRQVDVIKVFAWPTPEFSPNNFFLDTRTYARSKKMHLRLVDLKESGKPVFGQDSAKSWGTFGFAVNDLVIHPAGYAIGINYETHRMAIITLSAEGFDDDKAPEALVFGGPGFTEGMLKGPVAMTVTADGRILILESQNARVQSFDTLGNPVPCFKAGLKFSTPGSFATDLDAKTLSIGMLQLLQQQVPVLNNEIPGQPQRYLNTSKANLDVKFKGELDKRTVNDEMRAEFTKRALELSTGAVVHVTKAGELWMIKDGQSTYDLRLGKEGRNEINVYMPMSFTVTEKAKGSHWQITDNGNALTFDVMKDKAGLLQFHRLSPTMQLKQQATMQYLDIACEMKGYIYVLANKRPLTSASDYRLDIYSPDGEPLSPDSDNGQPAAARLAVDQWRNMFTLNYDYFSGQQDRPEPGISVWIPNA